MYDFSDVKNKNIPVNYIISLFKVVHVWFHNKAYLCAR